MFRQIPNFKLESLEHLEIDFRPAKRAEITTPVKKLVSFMLQLTVEQSKNLHHLSHYLLNQAPQETGIVVQSVQMLL